MHLIAEYCKLSFANQQNTTFSHDHFSIINAIVLTEFDVWFNFKLSQIRYASLLSLLWIVLLGSHECNPILTKHLGDEPKYVFAFEVGFKMPSHLQWRSNAVSGAPTKTIPLPLLGILPSRVSYLYYFGKGQG